MKTENVDFKKIFIGTMLLSKETICESNVGVFGHTVVKPNTKNAIYAGLSQTAQEESQRQAQRLNNTQAYVTIKAGVALIVNLTSAYRGE